MNGTQLKRKELGLCTQCGNETQEKVLCNNCSQKIKDRKEKLKLLGLCALCGHEYAEPNKTKCFKCAEKDRLRQEKYRESEDYRENQSKGSKKRYQYRKEKGLCVVCGKKQQEKGLKCISCYNKVKANRRRYNDKHGIPTDISRAERISYGLCYICGETGYDGHRVCRKHYYQRLHSMNKLKNMSLEDKNSYWSMYKRGELSDEHSSTM